MAIGIVVLSCPAGMVSVPLAPWKSDPEVPEPLAVAKLNETGVAGRASRLTVNSALCVPLFPSNVDTSLIEMTVGTSRSSNCSTAKCGRA